MNLLIFTFGTSPLGQFITATLTQAIKFIAFTISYFTRSIAISMVRAASSGILVTTHTTVTYSTITDVSELLPTTVSTVEALGAKTDHSVISTVKEAIKAFSDELNDPFSTLSIAAADCAQDALYVILI